MLELVSVLSALIINFYSPKINKSINIDTEIIWSFPYQYFEGETLTN
jgi:hypothetical protein